MTEDLLVAIKNFTEVSEGRIPWLYRDSAAKGNATCGIGHIVLGYDMALAQPFKPKILKVEWDALMSEPSGMAAKFYKPLTQGRLSNVDINNILDTDLKETIRRLTTQFSKFESFPDNVQAAMTDMAFNLGLAGFQAFGLLNAAIAKQDWAACASQCHRRGISAGRNMWTSQMFYAGASGISQ